MSKAQRRDHRIESIVTRFGEDVQRCGACGDRVCPVYDRSLPVKHRHYWRHWRRPPQTAQG